MTRPPDFRDLVGEDVPPEELGRLRRVHELLIAAGPPPELSPELASTVPAPPVRRPTWERRRWAVLALAASLMAAAFVGGTVYGQERKGFDSAYSVPMHGTGTAARALGTLQVGDRDASGNWPMLLKVQGLRKLPPRGYYELLVTQNGKRFPCGTFLVHDGTTSVRLNAPYRLNRSTKWVVVIHPRGHVEHPPTVMTT